LQRLLLALLIASSTLLACVEQVDLRSPADAAQPSAFADAANSNNRDAVADPNDGGVESNPDAINETHRDAEIHRDAETHPDAAPEPRRDAEPGRDAEEIRIDTGVTPCAAALHECVETGGAACPNERDQFPLECRNSNFVCCRS